MFPAARLSDKTVTNDTIIGPGAPTVLIGGMPAACVGDAVVGNLVVGSIVMGSFTVLIGGRFAARTTSQVVGINVNAPPTPITTFVGKAEMTVLIGG
ncbi:PaaR repeat-containing protein [Pseudanabaena sp. SR411]|uniref:PAAR domain-containing protein n=1 Tax=Pseudanabaena sp. SR411 TaxID=1980935 RepID=UPI000B97D92B|nr:PAAR domain-containing protein [Pseudanabaena sp. SR411]OYQ67757.1 PaaR repeat-containing protein [Pseudanabaena sp. SR411]